MGYSDLDPAVHEDAAVNGEGFAAAAGHVAPILMGEADGFIDREFTPEGIGEAIARICDQSTFEPFADYVSSAARLLEFGLFTQPAARSRDLSRAG